MEATFCCDGMQLIVWKIRESLPSCSEGVIKRIVGIVHLIGTEYGFQAAFVKSFVMCNEWQPLNKWLYLCPHIWKGWRIVGILLTQAVNTATYIVVIVWLWLYK